MLKRLSDSFIPVIIMGMFMVLSMSLLSQATENSSQFGRTHLTLVVVNAIGFLVLVGLIGINVIRMLRQYKRKVIGSRLTARMVMLFVVLSVVPVSIVYYFSIGFLERGIDSWFDVKMEQAMDDALELSRKSLDLKMRELLRRTRQVADELVDKTDSSALLRLDDLRIENDATELILLTQNGQVLASSNDDKLAIIPTRPDETILLQVAENKSFTGLAPVKDQGLLVRVAVAVPTLDSAEESRILYALYPITERISELANNVEAAYGQYKKLVFLREPLKDSFVLTLSLVLMLSVLTAVWAAFYSAQRLVAPIRILAIGTRAVAAGNYEKRLPDVSNDELGALVRSFSDMTEKLALARDEAKTSQELVEQERIYLGAVLGRLSSGVLTLDVELTIRVANNAASQILEIDLEDSMGGGLDQIALMAPQLSDFVGQVTTHLYNNDSEWREEILIKQQTGTKILICQGVRLVSEVTDNSGFVVVFDDVTTFMQAQHAAAWGDVARRLAHEIKNPLTPIQLSAERLKRKLHNKVDAHDADILDRATYTIVQQVQTMKKLVKAFSEYARVPKIELRPLYIDSIVSEVIDLYADDQAQVKFEVDVSDDHPKVAADPGRLRQLLNNLIKNAMESTKDVASPCIEIIVRRVSFQTGYAAELRVRDNGHGISENLLDRLFDSYATTKSKGGGLGLAVVSRIVEEHGGKVFAENNLEAGACFVVQIPAIDNRKDHKGSLLVQAT